MWTSTVNIHFLNLMIIERLHKYSLPVNGLTCIDRLAEKRRIDSGMDDITTNILE